MVSFYEFSGRLKAYDILRKEGSSMSNLFESLDTLEQRALGVTAWLTAHSNQLSQMMQQAEQTKKDVADFFKQVQAIKQEMQTPALARRKPDEAESVDRSSRLGEDAGATP
jgi:ABC-type transporter Mla subunit MlaD